MANPTITQAFEDTGNTVESVDLITAATSLATAITAARDANALGGSSAGQVATVVHDSLQDELIDFCERVGKHLSATP
jgi:hypothetical protein